MKVFPFFRIDNRLPVSQATCDSFQCLFLKREHHERMWDTTIKKTNILHTEVHIHQEHSDTGKNEIIIALVLFGHRESTCCREISVNNYYIIIPLFWSFDKYTNLQAAKGLQQEQVREESRMKNQLYSFYFLLPHQLCTSAVHVAKFRRP